MLVPQSKLALSFKASQIALLFIPPARLVTVEGLEDWGGDTKEEAFPVEPTVDTWVEITELPCVRQIT